MTTTTETREQRGLTLFRERGAEIVLRDNGTYRVPSCSGDATYTVNLDLDYCSCPDHQYREAECKHLVAATIANSKRRCRRTATVHRASRRHGRATEQQDDRRTHQAPTPQRTLAPERPDSLRGVLTTPDALDRIEAKLEV